MKQNRRSRIHPNFCPLCKKVRPAISFVVHRSHCQICEEDILDVTALGNEVDRLRTNAEKVQAAERWRESRDRRLALGDDDEPTMRMRSVRLVRGCLKRAAERNMDFNLTVGWAEDRLRAGSCEMTGIPFSMTPDAEYRRSPWSPSIDRRDSAKGYTIDNAQLVVLIYNTGKMEWPESAVLQMARALCQRYPVELSNDNQH